MNDGAAIEPGVSDGTGRLRRALLAAALAVLIGGCDKSPAMPGLATTAEPRAWIGTYAAASGGGALVLDVALTGTVVRGELVFNAPISPHLFVTGSLLGDSLRLAADLIREPAASAFLLRARLAGDSLTGTMSGWPVPSPAAFACHLLARRRVTSDEVHDVPYSVLAIVGLWLLQKIVLAVVYRRLTDPYTRYRWRKATTYAFIVVGVLVVGRQWLEGFKALATFLGLVSAGIAIALKDPLTNLAGWAFIVSRRPFDVGDRIEISGQKGDVIDQRLFQFTLNEIGAWVDADQSTGRIIHIPNAKIFTEPVANYDKGFKYIWNEVPVVVTYESDWKKAREVLTAIAFKHAEHLTAEAERDLLTASRQYFINYRKLTPIVYVSSVDFGVRLTMRYLIEPRRRRGTVSAIWEDILTEFAKCPDIDLAYHTVRSFRSTEEGKHDLRPAPPGRTHRRRDDPPPQEGA